MKVDEILFWLNKIAEMIGNNQITADEAESHLEKSVGDLIDFAKKKAAESVEQTENDLKVGHENELA